MDTRKNGLLEESYERIINVGLCIVPYEDLSDLAAPELMFFGTTKDEKVFSFSELDAMFKSQYEQMAGFVNSLDRKRLFTRTSNDGKNAFITEEVTLTMTSPEEVNTIFMRCSCVMEYIDNQWKLTHLHASTPVDTENDHWHMEEWKREKEKLQQLVDEQTADLYLKNRELEIEAALERVRAQSMGMHKSDDLIDVVREIEKGIHELGIQLHHSQIYTDYDYTYDPKTDVNIWVDVEGQDYLEKFHLPYIDHTITLNFINALNEGLDYFSDRYSKAEKDSYFKLLFKYSDLKRIPKKRKELILNASGWTRFTVILNEAALNFGRYNLDEFTDEEQEIFIRFAKVFGQAYTRFLDLKKAEEQVREAQIEAALERVRSRSLAMQKTNELQDVVRVVAEELKNTGVILDTWGAVICTYFEDSKDVLHWTASEDPANPSVAFLLPYFEDELYDEAWNSKNRGDSYFAKVFSFDVKNAFFKHAFQHSDYRQLPEDYKKLILESKSHGIAWAWSKNSAIMIPSIQGDLPSEDEKEILIRFAKVFEQSYTRFLDLQKAEEQAREARIEAALEKVRSRTMGMRSSDELPEVANLLFLEVQALGIPAWSCGYNILEEDKKSANAWMSSEGHIQDPFKLRLDGEASFDEMWDFIQSEKTMLVQELSGEALKEHYKYMKTFPDLQPTFKKFEEQGLSLPTNQINHLCKFGHGFLMFITYEPVPDAHEMFIRFTKVFDQTYTRFLDLKKAEKQAREAQIEAALEKVRSRSLAMQSPDELIEVAQLLREEMGALGVEELETSSIYIHEEHSGNTQCWFAIKDSDSGKAVTDQMTIDLKDTWVGSEMLNFYRSDAKQTSILMQGEKRIEWIRYCGEKSNAFTPDSFYGDSIPERTYQLYKFSNGYIGAASPGEISNESWELLRRATSVFSFAYTRFRDLQNAEEQAREARIELSLERIRAQVASMQESSDLFDIVVSMRTEFLALGHEADYFWHMRWLPDSYEMSMTSEDGSRIGMVISLPKFVHDEIPALAEWEKGDDPIYVLALDPADAWSYIDNMNTHGAYELADPNAPGKEDIEHIGGLTFIMARTTHGEIGYGLPGMVPEPPKDALDTLVRFAGVFDLAYKRFEDLQESEQQARLILEERDRLEAALKELHSTQDQLIQQEKLASLGQLTAGIAHEIKNPLNFVNNFSEVSLELLEEALDEIAQIENNEHATESSELLADIKSNITKIHQHGTRANGIVSSMLQHSRGGSGKMEPTDLNALLKEYTNLAFHGMRAGKNPINVNIQLDLDEKVGNVNLIGEDFSRVVLNLSNNAFDAMREKAKTATDYIPTLSIKTRLTANGERLIAITDNGPGIPNEIKDKILQPFFTTKKGTEGTGLGLSITNDIIKAHGGELSVNSTSGSGSTFIITLKP